MATIRVSAKNLAYVAAALALIGLVALILLTNNHRYEYTLDGKTYEAKKCYYESDNYYCITNDEKKIKVDSYRSY